MKKWSVVAIAILLMANLHAQYKKASFLTKSGRTYDLGVTGHILSNGSTVAPGFYYSFGREKYDKRLFSWFDFEYVLPTTFTYNTIDTASKNPVKVTGKSHFGIFFKYSLAYYLLNNSGKGNKVLPFVTLGLENSIVSPNLLYRNVSYSPESYTGLQKEPTLNLLNLGAHVGAGLIYKFSKTTGIKLGVGYTFVYNTNLDFLAETTSTKSEYYFFSSHPYASLGIHFTVPSRH